MRPRSILCVLAVLALAVAPACAQVLYSTGFEASEGYTLGLISGQLGWTESATPNEAYVTDQASYEGDRSLLFAAYHGRGLTRAFSAGGAVVRADVVMAKAYANTGQLFFALQGTGGTSDRSCAFGFNAGELAYYRGVSGSGGAWVGLGAFNAGEAYTFRAEVDTTQKLWSLWINGSLVASDIPAYHASITPVSQVYVYRGYLSISGQEADYNYGMVDSIMVTAVPEPSCLAALAFGSIGLGGLLRRRK